MLEKNFFCLGAFQKLKRKFSSSRNKFERKIGSTTVELQQEQLKTYVVPPILEDPATGFDGISVSLVNKQVLNLCSDSLPFC